MAVITRDYLHISIYTCLKAPCRAMPCSDRICETDSSERNILSDGPGIGQKVL